MKCGQQHHALYVTSEVADSMQGALLQFCRRLISIILVATAAFLVPLRAVAQIPPQAGSTFQQLVHVASSKNAGCQSVAVPQGGNLPEAEPTVDSSSQVRGGSSTTTAGPQLNGKETMGATACVPTSCLR
jgi:hypothetical protein